MGTSLGFVVVVGVVVGVVVVVVVVCCCCLFVVVFVTGWDDGVRVRVCRLEGRASDGKGGRAGRRGGAASSQPASDSVLGERGRLFVPRRAVVSRVAGNRPRRPPS